MTRHQKRILRMYADAELIPQDVLDRLLSEDARRALEEEHRERWLARQAQQRAASRWRNFVPGLRASTFSEPAPAHSSQTGAAPKGCTGLQYLRKAWLSFRGCFALTTIAERPLAGNGERAGGAS